MGAGTVALVRVPMVARISDRRINPAYVSIAKERLRPAAGAALRCQRDESERLPLFASIKEV